MADNFRYPNHCVIGYVSKPVACVVLKSGRDLTTIPIPDMIALWESRSIADVYQYDDIAINRADNWITKVIMKYEKGELSETESSVRRRVARVLRTQPSRVTILDADIDGGVCRKCEYILDKDPSTHARMVF